MDSDFGAFVCGLALGALVAVLLASGLTSEAWRADAIKRGVAQYNQITGTWEWTVPTKTAEAVK